MLYALIIAITVLNLLAWIYLIRKRQQINSCTKLRRWRMGLWVIGGVLAVLAVTVTWPSGNKVRFLGFPLPGAAFELVATGAEPYWADFVGPLTLPILVIDFVFCLCLPQVALAILLLVGKRSAPTIRQADAADGPLRGPPLHRTALRPAVDRQSR